MLRVLRCGGGGLTPVEAGPDWVLPDDVAWIDLTDPPLPPFVDLRPGFALPTGPVLHILQAMQTATDIVFVAPVYWYALPAPAKLLLDHWSGWLDAAETGFADWAKAKSASLMKASRQIGKGSITALLLAAATASNSSL